MDNDNQPQSPGACQGHVVQCGTEDTPARFAAALIRATTPRREDPKRPAWIGLEDLPEDD